MNLDLRKAAELGLYVAFAIVMAGVAGFISRRNQPATLQPAIQRSMSDSAVLMAALNLKKGQTAVIEFMDFECPPCRLSYPKIKTQLAKRPNSIYREVNFPLAMHPNAFGAAVASEIAREGGMHDAVFDELFTGKVDLDPKSLNAYLLSRNLHKVVGGKESASLEKKVKSDIAIGKALNINATPTVMVLGRDGTLTEVRDLDLIPDLLN